MTARRSMTKRRSVIPSSRTTTRAVTHHHRSPVMDSSTKADSVRALSAMGSAILPKLVTRLRLRASWPSRRSVAAASIKTSAAAIRGPWPSRSMRTTKTGTMTSLSTVRALAILSRGAFGAWVVVTRPA